MPGRAEGGIHPAAILATPRFRSGCWVGKAAVRRLACVEKVLCDPRDRRPVVLSATAMRPASHGRGRHPRPDPAVWLITKALPVRAPAGTAPPPFHPVHDPASRGGRAASLWEDGRAGIELVEMSEIMATAPPSSTASPMRRTCSPPATWNLRHPGQGVGEEGGGRSGLGPQKR